MKHLKLFLLVFVACIICNTVYAQQTDEVTLVVSADGPTKDEATKIALRSAIEQAYGTFVSANTTILNDELVKDEIVTISSGNIKNYSEVSSNAMPDGKFFVTLKATVSISKLVSYAQSKGAETEFAGATFGMNMKMKELNKKNEIKILKNLEKQINNISNLYDYELELEEPILRGNSFQVNGTVYLLFNTNTEIYNDLLFNTLNSLRLTDTEIDEYNKYGLEKHEVYNVPYAYKAAIASKDPYYKDFLIFLRSDYFNSDFKSSSFYKKLMSKHFIVSDNLSSPTKIKYTIKDYNLGCKNVLKKKSWDANPFCYYWANAGFLTNSIKLMKCNQLGDKVGYFKIVLEIPKENIGKYSNFRIEPIAVDDTNL